MKIALLTFTRDRLAYTQTCFASLTRNAGCPYDHYVLDQASKDGTQNWLMGWSERHLDRIVIESSENIGICRAANRLLKILDPSRYDVIVRYDNDCELTQPGTLKITAKLAARYGAIISPRVNGLINPPPALRTASLGGHLLDETAVLGGIFMVVPAFLFDEMGYRYDEAMPLSSGDEAIVPWWRSHGGTCGYLQGWSVNHYETSQGQKARYPSYQKRKETEMTA